MRVPREPAVASRRAVVVVPAVDVAAVAAAAAPYVIFPRDRYVHMFGL